VTAAPAAPAMPDLDLPPGLHLETGTDLAGGTATAVFDRPHHPRYRYLLTRIWDPAQPIACWIMLNPSTADHATNDATLTRVVKFTADAGCGGLAIVNLFALRSTDPRALRDHPDPVGPHNDSFIRQAVKNATGPVIAAWGAQGTLHGRADTVNALLTSTSTGRNCYGTTSDTSGHQPRHPLYLRGVTPLRPYTPGTPA
jgi:hypothetical protein